MSGYQVLECPQCHKLIGRGFWVAEALSFLTVCRCKRLLEIQKDYSVRVVQESVPAAS